MKITQQRTLIIQVQAEDWDEYNELVEADERLGTGISILRPNDPNKDQYGTGA